MNVRPRGYAAGMDEAMSFTKLVKGQLVEVTHFQGNEIGEVESVNYATGKVLVYFNDEACPHFTSFNLSQVRPLTPKLVGEDAGDFKAHIESMTAEEKSKVADRIYNHILKLLDRKIEEF